MLTHHVVLNKNVIWAFHKLLEISHKASHSFSKRCLKVAQKSQKLALCDESCSNVAPPPPPKKKKKKKKKLFVTLFLYLIVFEKYENCKTKLRISKPFLQCWGVAKELCPQLKPKHL